VLQNQLIETTFQQLWTRRELFLRSFAGTHNITLDVDDDERKKAMNKADDEDDKRKDSFATPSSSSPTTKSPPNLTLTFTSNLIHLRAAARHRALELLLEAWYEKLGTRSTPPDGWTKYSEKTTTQAVLALRSILTNGDPELKTPFAYLPGPRQAYWNQKLRSVNFWFTSPNNAIDFLSAFGIGASRFGSGISRVEVLQYTHEGTGGKCLKPEHHASERTWRAGVEQWLPNEFPPVRYCPCTEYRLLMKIVGNAQKLREPGREPSTRWMSNRLTQEWQAANLRAGIDFEKGEWPSEAGAGNLPFVFSLEGVAGFRMWHCFGKDEEKGIFLRTIRLEGRFAELL
jgi:hypothetical protein